MARIFAYNGLPPRAAGVGYCPMITFLESYRPADV